MKLQVLDIPPKRTTPRLCAICGAKVVNPNPRSVVCGSEACSVARTGKITLAQAIKMLL